MIHRRGFLTAGFGLGLGIGSGSPGANQPATEYDPKYDIPPVHPEFEEYERILAQTSHLPALGIPRSWSVVREGFHPVSPERVVIMKPGEHWSSNPYKEIGERICGKIRKESLMWGDKAYRDKRSIAKLYLIVELVAQLTNYYRVPELLESWAKGIAGRESLGTTGFGRHFAVLDRCWSPTVPTTNSPVDWWLFLFPEGVEWESHDDKPIHVLAAHVPQRHWFHSGDQWVYALPLADRSLRRVSDTKGLIRLSRMDRIAAARLLNKTVVQFLPNWERNGA